MGRRIILAFQRLGVVFGDIGTSPLYNFSVMYRFLLALTLVLVYTISSIYQIGNVDGNSFYQFYL
ncbi:potassium transporter 7, partial [Olea europaea subsp. europaea]